MMYKAKGAGKHQVGVPGELELAEVFRDMTADHDDGGQAINERRIVPFFQPILDMRGNRIAGYEVLSRLEHEGQFVEASRFIEFAEKAGVIHRLDTMVMEKALRTVAEAGFDGHIFINLSPRALTLVGLPANLEDDGCRLPASSRPRSCSKSPSATRSRT